MKKYRILSPDGFDISFEQMYYSKKEVKQALAQFKNRFSTQGYYSTSNRERIHLDDLIENCELIENQITCKT
jgi:hypothetical protein